MEISLKPRHARGFFVSRSAGRSVDAPNACLQTKAALVARDIRFVFVTGCADHGLPTYRDRPTLRLKRTLQERLGHGSHWRPSACGGPGKDRGRIAAIGAGQDE